MNQTKELYKYLRRLKDHLPDMSVVEILYYVRKSCNPTIKRNRSSDLDWLNYCKRYCKAKSLHVKGVD